MVFNRQAKTPLPTTTQAYSSHPEKIEMSLTNYFLSVSSDSSYYSASYLDLTDKKHNDKHYLICINRRERGPRRWELNPNRIKLLS